MEESLGFSDGMPVMLGFLDLLTEITDSAARSITKINAPDFVLRGERPHSQETPSHRELELARFGGSYRRLMPVRPLRELWDNPSLESPMPRGSRTVLLALACALAASGCVTTNASLLNPGLAARPKVPPEQVRIFRSFDQVPGKYEEIAILSSTGESNWTDEAAMLESMRQKAGALGAKGVVLSAIDEAGAGAKVAAAVFGTGTQRKGRAVAIYFVASDSAGRDTAGRLISGAGRR